MKPDVLPEMLCKQNTRDYKYVIENTVYNNVNKLPVLYYLINTEVIHRLVIINDDSGWNYHRLTESTNRSPCTKDPRYSLIVIAYTDEAEIRVFY